MKNIKIFLLLSLFLSVVSCEDYLDINRDPNSPSEADIQKLLPGIQSTLGGIYSYNFGAVGYADAVFSHQLSTRQPEYDNYGITGSAFAVSYWVDFYADALKDIDVILELAEEKENTLYAGIGKILKAYTYSTIVDHWGDVPFSEALQTGIVNPVYDDQVAIYTEVLAMLDEAVADLNNEEASNLEIPGDDDLIYGGNIDSWIKAANTIKLKLLTQVQTTSLYNQAEVDALLAEDGTNLISNWDESFLIPYGTSTSPDDRHPAFVSEYGGGQISNYISPWLYLTMTGEEKVGDYEMVFGGIEDPRIPYYWVNQITDGATENDPEFQDGNFVSIWFGSTGLNRDASGRATFTMMGIYPCGGKYDDGTGAPGEGLGTTAGTGAAPQRLLTYADRLYIEAELIHKGLASGDAGVVLEEAIYASFDQLTGVVEMVGTDQEVPTIADSVVTVYVDAVMAEFDAASQEKQLEIIMTQKWISSFGTSHDQYTDYRRTGYPVIFDPENEEMAPGGFVTGGPDGSGDVPVQQTRAYPLAWPYYNDELTLNANAPEQRTVATDGIFWDN